MRTSWGLAGFIVFVLSQTLFNWVVGGRVRELEKKVEWLEQNTFHKGSKIQFELMPDKEEDIFKESTPDVIIEWKDI